MIQYFSKCYRALIIKLHIINFILLIYLEIQSDNLYAFYVSSLLYCYKDPANLQEEFHLTVWALKLNRGVFNVSFELNILTIL